ncbi:MAG: CYTH domain-containing protein [bacterium]
MHEIELKLTADGGATLDRVLRCALVRRLDTGVGAADAVHYHGLYYDTDDNALERSGRSLRARREGERWRAACKFAGAIEHGLSSRRELEADIAGELDCAAQLPDGELKDRILEVIAADAPLHVRVRVDMRRSIRNLLLDDDGDVSDGVGVSVELVADRGVIHGRSEQVALHEIELELKSAQSPAAIAAVMSLGARLARDFALTPSTRSKRRIGLELG